MVIQDNSSTFQLQNFNQPSFVEIELVEDQNNLDPFYGDFFRCIMITNSSDININITGFINYINAGKITIYNSINSINNITLVNISLNSNEENRFKFNDGVDYVLLPGRLIELTYLDLKWIN